MNFHVGQQVVCVDDRFTNEYMPIGVLPRGGLDGLTKGRVYTVASIEEFLGQQVLVLEEICRPFVPGVEFQCSGFSARRFRPVRKTSIDVFTAMLAPTPKDTVSA